MACWSQPSGARAAVGTASASYIGEVHTGQAEAFKALVGQHAKAWRAFSSSSSAAKPADDSEPSAAPKIAKARRLDPIALTAKAADRIKEMLAGKDDVVGVHISVKRRGCNGYSYIMNYATEEMANAGKDEVVHGHGVIVLVDPKAIFFLVGTTMDWNETELASEFNFINPNVKGECGCGESVNF